MNCDQAPPGQLHYHYWYWVQLPGTEIYVKWPKVFLDRKAARRAGERDAGRVTVMQCDGPAG